MTLTPKKTLAALALIWTLVLLGVPSALAGAPRDHLAVGARSAERHHQAGPAPLAP